MASQWTYDSAASVAANNSALVISATVVPPVGSLLYVASHNHTTTSFSTGSIADNGASGAGQWHALGGESGSTAHFSAAGWYKIATAQDFNGGAGITVTVTWAGGSGTILTRLQCDVFTLPAGYTPVVDTFATNFGGTAQTNLITNTPSGTSWTDLLAIGALCTSTTSGGGSCLFSNLSQSQHGLTTAVATGDLILDVMYGTGLLDDPGGSTFLFSWTNSITSPIGMAAQFTYTPPVPTVTNVNPNTNGNPAGGDSVTITGTNFTDSAGAWQATGVSFGGTPAASFTVVNATTITAVTPAGTGTVDVTVTSIGGTSATSGADQFTYGTPPPPVTAPASTPGGGGDGEDRMPEQRAWWDTDEERDLEALIRLGAL